MTKKIIKSSICFVIILAVTVSLFIVGNKFTGLNYDTPSETFIGAVSNAAYSSKEAAAKAFITNELTGATSTPVYKSFEKIKDLTSSEIEVLPLDDDTRSKVESAENIVVRYVNNKVESSYNTNLLQIEGNTHYYVPPSENGQALTSTYFNSVLSGEKYVNCTCTTVLNLRSTNPNSSMDNTYKQTIKFANNIAYFGQEIPGTISELYFQETVDGIEAYLKHPLKKDEKFYSLSAINRGLYPQYVMIYLLKGNKQISLSSLETIVDVTDFMFMLDLDATYFEKTSYGFKMPTEKYKEVCNLMLGDSGYEQIFETLNEEHFYFNADYYVSDGRLSASEIVLVMSDGEDVFQLKVAVAYTDFGTTSVTLPDNVEV